MKKLIAVCALFLALYAKAPAATLSVADKVGATWNGVTTSETVLVRAEQKLASNLAIGLQTVVDLDSGDFKVQGTGLVLNACSKPIDKAKQTTVYLGGGVDVVRIENVKLTNLADIRSNAVYGGQVGVKHAISSKVSMFGEAMFRTRGGVNNGDTSLFAGLSYKL